MSRTLSWNSALRSLHADRQQFAPGERAAICRAATFAKLAATRARRDQGSRPLVVNGVYDRRAIMAAAIYSAQCRRQVTGEAWGMCLSAALKGRVAGRQGRPLPRRSLIGSPRRARAART
ncbi:MULTISPECIES: hypothetical protein [Methylobacterium]|uniref:Uncharacterized protein n=1 Tax=Methylobacterium hispanicum TaxID=270350 RepID=A0AAV4ZES2_9HYPH|nr:MULTISPECIES: hypothetical protein [Methylobacterium]GJD86916.1 hypothetical protein BHAOGJBA_0414 [Methylobacterium hispanicum]